MTEEDKEEGTEDEAKLFTGDSATESSLRSISKNSSKLRTRSPKRVKTRTKDIRLTSSGFLCTTSTRSQ
jgi:hypothetical protein